MTSSSCKNSVTTKSSSDFSVSITKGSDELKDDLRLSVLQSSDADLNTTREISVQGEHYCDPCKEDEKYLTVEGFCVDCNEYLCKDCFNFHKKQKTLKRHVLKDKSSMPQDRGEVSHHDVCVEKCSSHTDKIMEYFCQSCDQVGCSVCIVTKHRACTNVDFIPDIIESIENREECTRLTEYIQDLLVKLNHHKNRAESNIERSNDFQKKSKEDVKMQRGEIDKILDELQEEIYTKIDAVYKEDHTNLSSVTDLVNTLTSDLSEMSSDLKRNSKKRIQLFVSSKKMKQRMPEIEKSIKTLESQNKVQCFHYSHTHKIKDTLANTELGKVVFMNSETERFLSSCSYIRVNHCEDFTMVFYCGTGLCLLPNDRLALTDGEHESCKLIDLEQKRVTFCFRFGTNTFDVTTMPENQIAVTLPDTGEMKILAVTPEETLTEVRSFDTGRGCCGVHYSNDKFIVSFKKCLGSKPRLKIFDTAGTILNIIETDEYGRALFASSFYVTVSPDCSTIYVSDKKDKAITALTRDGKVKAVYRMETSPSGIAVDEVGSVYVCVHDDFMKSDIIQLTENCERVKTPLQLDKYYNCITYSDEKKTIYLAGMSEFENQHVLVVDTACDSNSEKI